MNNSVDTDISYNELSFPVIWIGTKDIRASHDVLHFRTCESSFLKAGFRKRGVVVDARLVCREVLATRQAGYAPPLWGFRWPGVRHYLMDYEWSKKPPYTISLDEMKQLIIEAKRKSGMYVGMAGSQKAYERKILNFQSYAELVQYFGRPSKTNYFAKLVAGPFDG